MFLCIVEFNYILHSFFNVLLLKKLLSRTLQNLLCMRIHNYSFLWIYSFFKEGSWERGRLSLILSANLHCSFRILRRKTSRVLINIQEKSHKLINYQPWYHPIICKLAELTTTNPNLIKYFPTSKIQLILPFIN